jgi:hypothetical protein
MKSKEAMPKEKRKPEVKEFDLKTLLSKQNKEELLSIILNLLEDFPEIEGRLRFKYASTDNEITASKKLIREYINKAKRQGFIDWRSASYAVQGAVLTLEKARDALGNNELARAVQLSVTVLSIVVDMLQYCDDSDGSVGSVIRESVSMIKEACSLGEIYLNEKDQMKLFKEVLKEASHKRYDGWDEWRFELLEGCVHLASQTEIRLKLEEKLEDLMEDSSSWSAEHTNKQIKLIQLKLIELYDNEEKKEQFIRDNLHYSDIREISILNHIEKKQYVEAINLCEEGIIKDKQYSGLLDQWKMYKYKAYEGLGDTDNQQKLALEFVYGNKDEFYSILRDLYTDEEWKHVLGEIVETFEKMSYQPEIFVEILIRESLVSNLLEYCLKNKSRIVHLYQHLLEEYPDEVNEIFKEYIENTANEANERRKYKEVCKIISTYKKACGTKKAEELITGLKKQHIRIPAFLDELEKVK